MQKELKAVGKADARGSKDWNSRRRPNFNTDRLYHLKEQMFGVALPVKDA